VKQVSIIGVGLIGGSLGKALVRQKRWRVVGIGRHPARLNKAKALGCAHEVTTDMARGVHRADVVVIASPVGDIVPLAKKLRPFMKPGALVMDVGSVKAPIVSALNRVFSKREGPYFVGAHPMAGSEKNGVEHARKDLFSGATCVLTPAPSTPRPALKRARHFWKSVGARLVQMTPEKHDRAVAVVSHLPHVLADALVWTAVRSVGRAAAASLAAGSFRDATRVAASDPVLWRDIFRSNAKALSAAVRLFQGTLKGFLGGSGLEARLRAARALHERIMGKE
jgi:prephenate dehydrogenase